LLQQEVMDQYNAKMQFADVQIQASEGSRKYAADSIIGSSPVSAELTKTNIEKIKFAAQVATQFLMNTVQPVPYH
jgi:hypothetical protein